MAEYSDFNKKLMKAMGVKKSSPNISINKLGEYLTAKPNRRNSILRALKYPKDEGFGKWRYREARQAIKDYFVNDFDENVLLDCISDLKAKKTSSDSQEGDRKSSIKAINKLLDSDLDIDDAFVFTKYEGNNPKVEVEGVKISVNPDLIIRSTKMKKNYVGALKTHIIKTFPLDEEGSKYVSAILYRFTEDYIMEENESVRHSNCVSFDVFGDIWTPAPKSIINRWKDINAGCTEISNIWDSI